MLRVQFDTKSNYSVRLPTGKRKLYHLAVDYVTHEETIPAAEQTSFTADIIGLVEQVDPLFDRQQTGEANRVQASEALKKYEQEAHDLARQLQGLMQAYFPQTPEAATRWGFQIRQSGSRPGAILLPPDREALLVLLDAYITAETERPEAERFPVPALETVTGVRDGLMSALQERQAARAQREASVALTNELQRELHDYLQAALVYLVVKRFNRKVTPELQAWGFDVVEVRPASSAPPAGDGAE